MTNRWFRSDARRLEAAGLLALFVLALSLRIWGIDHGLPYGQIPDESGDIGRSLKIVVGQLPEYAYHRVGWPIAQIPLHGLHFLALWLTQTGFTLDQFQAQYYVARDDFVLLTRVYLALLMALVPLFVYNIGKRIADDWRGGALAGVLMAVHPTHVYLSHVALPDGFATLWVAVALWAALIVAQRGSRWAYFVGGGAAALAMLARLQTLMIVMPLLIAHLWVWPAAGKRSLAIRWLWAAAGFTVLSVLFNPYILVTPAAVIADIQFIFGQRYTGGSNARSNIQQLSVFASSMRNAELPWTFVRPYFFVAATLGSGWALYKRSLLALIVAAFGAVFTLSILPAVAPRISFWLPATIPACILTGYGLHGLWREQRGRATMIPVLLVVAVVVAALFETVTLNRVLAVPSTQALAYEYITTHIPADTALMQGDGFIYSVPLARNPASIGRLKVFGALPPAFSFFNKYPALNRKPAYDVYGPEHASEIASDADMRAFLRTNRIDFIIEADYCGGDSNYDHASGQTFPVLASGVRAELRLEASFSPFGSDECKQSIENRTHMEYMRLLDWERIGPINRIYRVSRPD